MSPSSLNEEVALRIGLATRALKTVDTKAFINLLIRITGKPITLARLSKLRAKRVRSEGADLFVKVSHDDFENAFALLKGRGIQQYLHPSPSIQPGTFCDIRGALMVAVASNSGEQIDGGFINCHRFLIYQVSADAIRLIDMREPAASLKGHEKLNARANLIKDCTILYTLSVSARSAARLVKTGIHPITETAECEAIEPLTKLQQRLNQDRLPRWIEKALDSENVNLPNSILKPNLCKASNSSSIPQDFSAKTKEINA